MSILIDTIAAKEDIANIRKEMAENQTANIKWMFVFWIGQFAATVAVIIILLKK